MNRRVLVTVSGRVQGVNFRYYTQVTARQLGVARQQVYRIMKRHGLKKGQGEKKQPAKH